jgi:hypothetical protein
MLWTIIVLLVILWSLGAMFKIAGALVHILLVTAVVLFLVRLISGRRTSA